VSGSPMAVVDSAVGDTHTSDLSITSPTFYHSAIEPHTEGALLPSKFREDQSRRKINWDTYFSFIFSNSNYTLPSPPQEGVSGIKYVVDTMTTKSGITTSAEPLTNQTLRYIPTVNPNHTTKQHTIVSIQLNIVTCQNILFIGCDCDSKLVVSCLLLFYFIVLLYVPFVFSIVNAPCATVAVLYSDHIGPSALINLI